MSFARFNNNHETGEKLGRKLQNMKSDKRKAFITKLLQKDDGQDKLTEARVFLSEARSQCFVNAGDTNKAVYKTLYSLGSLGSKSRAKDWVDDVLKDGSAEKYFAKKNLRLPDHEKKTLLHNLSIVDKNHKDDQNMSGAINEICSQTNRVNSMRDLIIN